MITDFLALRISFSTIPGLASLQLKNSSAVGGLKQFQLRRFARQEW